MRGFAAAGLCRRGRSLGFRRGALRLIGHINLGKGNQSGIYTQHLHNLQVLSGLGHYAFIRRHHQQPHINAAGAAHHGMHKVLMARHINDADPESIRKIEMRKP